jgi:hypothetical protein
VAELLRYLEWLAIVHAARASARDILYHAAAVTKQSRTILLVGESGAGKTTVTTGLVERGWLPLSDDIVLVSPQSLAIAPFPRCFHTDDFTAALMVDSSLWENASSLPGYVRPRTWAEAPSRVSCLVRLARDAAAPTSALPICQAEGAGVLLQAAISKGYSKCEMAHVAVGVAAGASCWQVNNGRLGETLDAFERLSLVERMD